MDRLDQPARAEAAGGGGVLDRVSFSANPDCQPTPVAEFCEEHLHHRDLDPELSRVAEYSGQAVGFLLARRRREQNSAYVDLLGVHPEHRGAKLSRAHVALSFLCQPLAVPHRQAPARTIAQVGELVAEVDPRRPSGRLLRQGGMDASYVDLADARHLEFDYMRWLRIVLQAAGARRVLHVGGGACALARALAAEDPDGRQEVCEVDEAVLALAREHLGLRRAPGLRVRHAEGRDHIAAQPDDSWEAIVIDAFIGAGVPARLITVEALIDAARVAPLTLINVLDNRSAREVRAVVAATAVAYPSVWTLGQRAGNTIVAGNAAGHEPDLARIRARAATDASPARLAPPEQIRQIATSVFPLHDGPEPAR